MNKMDPTEVLNDNIEYLIDYLKRELRCLGKMNGLSDSQISDMERDFIARLAFAAIIGDDEKKDECEDCSAKDCCALKKHEKKPEDLPEFIGETLSFIKEYCKERDCDDCAFSESYQCKLKYTPNEWEV